MKPERTLPRVLFIVLGPKTGLAAAVEESLDSSCCLVREEVSSPPGTASTGGADAGMPGSWRDLDIAGAVVCASTIDSASEERIEATLSALCGLPVLLVSDDWHADVLRRLLWRGACDFATRPFQKRDIALRVARMVGPAPESRPGSAPPSLAGHPLLPRLIDVSEEFQKLVRRTVLAGTSVSTILIQGETGTGKGLFAEAIHELSGGAGRSFVAVNCGALPADLVENEFFGHEPEAFTGAAGSRHGVVHQADGGSLFLDEVNSLPLPAQAKLLELLESGMYRRLGSGRTLKANVRFIAATNADLLEAVRSGKFRADLYQRLAGFTLHMPVLRERVVDILPLSMHFLRESASRLGRPLPALSSDAAAKLFGYRWPGNVRELKQAIEKAIVLAENRGVVTAREIELDDARHAFDGSLRQARDQAELAYIEGILMAHSGNLSRAARSAKTHRRTLRRLIEKHGIDVDRFRTEPT